MNRLCFIALLALTACTGILGDIYDNPSDTVPEGLPYGYMRIDEDSLGGQLFFDSTDYLAWTYFNLRSLASARLSFGKDDDMASLEAGLEDWDIAFHRSVPKTNGSEVAETRYTKVDEVARAAAGGIDGFIKREGLVFEGDVWSDDVVTIDLSGMMDGTVVCQKSPYNAVLNRWLDIDVSDPPPIYTPSHRAYVLHLASGEYYAIALVNFRNSSNMAAWLTIDFRRL